MTSRTKMQENLGVQFRQHDNPINPSSVQLPRLAGRRQKLENLGHEHEISKRFKPNLEGSRTRPSSENVKEDIQSSTGTHNHDSLYSEPLRTSTSQNLQSGDTEFGQPEGGESGAIEGDSEEGGYLQGPKENHTKSKLLETESIGSTVASPASIAVESNEMIAELDLAQDAFDEASSRPLDFQCPASLTEAELKKFLEKLSQEKSLICTSIKRSFKNLCITFKCTAGHSFTIRSFEEIVCPKCEVILAKCSEYAQQHHGNYLFNDLVGRLLNERYEEYMSFECESKHIWKVKYSN